MEDAVRALQQQVNALMSQNAALEAQLINQQKHCTRSCSIAWSNHDRAESSASGTIASTNDGFPAGGAVSVGPADVWKEFEVFQKGCGWGSFRNDDRAPQTIALRWQGHEDVVPFG